MTLESAIKHCEEVATKMECEAMCVEEAYQTARQADCEKCAEEHRQLAEWLTDYQRLLKSLPSVNPQKIGHWIADVDKWGDVVTTVNGYRCDKCNTFNADKDNYCPNCGAKMVES